MTAFEPNIQSAKMQSKRILDLPINYFLLAKSYLTHSTKHTQPLPKERKYIFKKKILARHCGECL
jgi:hypothetical protein